MVKTLVPSHSHDIHRIVIHLSVDPNLKDTAGPGINRVIRGHATSRQTYVKKAHGNVSQ